MRGKPVGGAIPPKRKGNADSVGDRTVVVVIPPNARSTSQQFLPRFGFGGPTADQQRIWNHFPEPYCTLVRLYIAEVVTTAALQYARTYRKRQWNRSND